jgi:hypothetical protein
VREQEAPRARKGEEEEEEEEEEKEQEKEQEEQEEVQEEVQMMTLMARSSPLLHFLSRLRRLQQPRMEGVREGVQEGGREVRNAVVQV